MQGLNKVMLIGNLGRDPETRQTQNSAVCNFSIATTEVYFDSDKQKQERVEWHNITVWGKRGEALGNILHKGSRIYVEGRLQTQKWDDKDGNKRTTTNVVATEIILLDSRNKATETENPSSSGNDDTDIPF